MKYIIKQRERRDCQYRFVRSMTRGNFYTLQNRRAVLYLPCMKTEKAKQCRAGNIDYTLIRSERRTVGLEVKADGAVIVRAPLRLNETEVRAFVISKADWIERSKAKAAARQAEIRDGGASPFTGADGDILPYLGGTLTITRREDAREPYVEGGILVLPPDAEQNELVLWLQNRAADELNPRLRKYRELIGVSYRSVRLSDARTRWGMCSGRDSINLSWRLIFCPPEAIDYVVAHELCHVKFKNHGEKFKAELERVLPGSAQIDKWFKANGKLITLF